MDKSTFISYTNANEKLLAEMLDTGDYDLSKLHIFEQSKTEKPLSFYLHKGFDLIAGAASGCLIYPTLTGADAIYIDPQNTNSEFEDVELKFAEIDQNKIFQSERGTLYVAQDITKARYKNTRASLRSAIEASYKLHSHKNKLSKNMITILVAFDRTANRIIDVFKLDGNTVMRYLNRSDNNKRSIKLSSFVENGTRISTDLSYGLENFEKSMRNLRPIF